MADYMEKAWERFQREVAPTDDEIEDIAGNHTDEMGNMPEDTQVDFARAVLKTLSLRYLVAQKGLECPNRAAWDVLTERARQISEEGWTSEHDDQHRNGELAVAAACYITHGEALGEDVPPSMWPWHADWWKPSDRRRNLVKASALILAEIERQDREDEEVLDLAAAHKLGAMRDES